MSADDHDQKTALVSHLPAMISKALLRFVKAQDPSSLHIAGPGFQSMTRLAKGNPQLMTEIQRFNKKNLELVWKKWVASLSERNQKKLQIKD